MHLPNEMLDHFFGHFKIGDDTIAHGANCLNVSRRSAQHELRVVSDGAYLALSAFRVGRYDRRLIKNNAAATDVDQRVRSTEIDGHVTRENSE